MQNILSKAKDYLQFDKREGKRVLILLATSTVHPHRGIIGGFVENNFNTCTFRFIEYFEKFGSFETNKMILKIVDFFKPDWIHMQLQFYKDIVSLDTVASLKKMFPNSIVTNWSADVRNDAPSYFVEVGKLIDKSLIVSEGQIELYKNAGCENVEYWQNAIEPSVFFRRNDEERVDLYNKNRHDVVFCAKNCSDFYSFPGHEIREKLINWFDKNLDNKFCVYGHGWNMIKNSRPETVIAKQNEIYNGAKIVLSISHYNDIRKYFSDRQLIAMACGTLVLSHYVPGLEEYFINNQDLVWFNSEEECIEKVKYFLQHEDEAYIIGKNGAKKIKENHTYYHRVNELAKRLGFL